MRRVDDHDIRSGDRGDHAVAAGGELPGPPLLTDQRIALGVLALVADLALGHAGVLAVAAHHDEHVDRGEDQTDGDRGLQQAAVPSDAVPKQARDRMGAAGGEHRHQPAMTTQSAMPIAAVFSRALAPLP